MLRYRICLFKLRWHTNIQVRFKLDFVVEAHTLNPDQTALRIQTDAQWLSGRVLDSRPKGGGFEPHRRHCVVVLEQDTFILA